jgi:Fe-S-cluster containining protein
VTPGDAQRIADHGGNEDFFEYRRPELEAYVDQDDDPLWRDHVYRSDGRRRVLRRQPQGDCTFLGLHGCRLPLDVRPLICRLYPFDYTADGLRDELAHGCPVELLRPGEELLSALAMQRIDAERWHTQLYAEILEEPHAVVGACYDADRLDI